MASTGCRVISDVDPAGPPQAVDDRLFDCRRSATSRATPVTAVATTAHFQTFRLMYQSFLDEVVDDASVAVSSATMQTGCQVRRTGLGALGGAG